MSTKNLDELYTRWMNCEAGETLALYSLQLNEGSIAHRAAYEQAVERTEAAEADYRAAVASATSAEIVAPSRFREPLVSLSS